MTFFMLRLQNRPLLAKRLPRERRRGAAILISLVTLMMMVALAVPFAISTGHHQASAQSNLNKARAKLGAESAANHALASLRQTDRSLQFSRWIEFNQFTTPGGDDVEYEPLEDPFIDRFDEIPAEIAGRATDRYPSILWQEPIGGNRETDDLVLQSKRHQAWTVSIEDEQGKINLNSVPATVLGNLMGSAIVESAEISSGSDGRITVLEGGNYFPAENGAFVINGVLCTYRENDGSTFRGVRVGIAGDDHPLGNIRDEDALIPLFYNDPATAIARVQGRGALVIPVAAYLIPYYRLLLAEGTQLGRFATVDQVRAVPELNVMTFGEDMVAPEVWKRIRRYLTVHSKGKANNDFHFPHIVETISHSDETGDSPENQLAVIDMYRDDVINPQWLHPEDPRRNPNARGVPSGCTIRLTFPDGEQRLALSIAGSLVTSIDPIRDINDRRQRPIAEIQEVAPININRASREVIVANFKGLGAGENVVTEEMAHRIVDVLLFIRDRDRYELFSSDLKDAIVISGEASRILEPFEDGNGIRFGGIKSHAEFEMILRRMATAGEGVGLPEFAPGVIMNAVRNPYGRRTQMICPISYASRGTYTVESHATVFNRTGFDTAHHGLRRTFHIGLDGLYEDERAIWSWLDYQQQVDELRHAQGNVFTHQLFQTDNRRRFGRHFLPWLLERNVEWGAGPATVRLAPARDRNFNQLFRGASGGAGDLQGTVFEFWYRVPQGFRNGRTSPIIDTAERPGVNQLSVLWWNGPSSSGMRDHMNALAIRVADRTLERAYNACFMNLPSDYLREDEWYHIRAGAKGFDPSHLYLMVDGIADRGEGDAEGMHVVWDEVAQNWKKRSSKLAAPMNQASTHIAIPADDAQDFPNWGVVKVGDEAIEYDGKDSNGLRIRTTYDYTDQMQEIPDRHARGTGYDNHFANVDEDSFLRGRSHPAGETVQTFGYASTIDNHQQAPNGLMEGGANLASPLTGPGAFILEPSAVATDASYAFPEIFMPGVGIGANGGSSALRVSDGRWPLAAQLQERGLMYVRGPAWNAYVQVTFQGLGEVLVPGWYDVENGETPDQANALLDEVQVADGEYEYRFRGSNQTEFIPFRRSGSGVVFEARRYNEDFDLKSQDAWNHYLAMPTSLPAELTIVNGYRDLGTHVLTSSIHSDRNPTGRYPNPQGFNVSGVVTQQIGRLSLGRTDVQADNHNDYVRNFEWVIYDRFVPVDEAGVTWAFGFTFAGAMRGYANSVNQLVVAAGATGGTNATAVLPAPPYRDHEPRDFNFYDTYDHTAAGIPAAALRAGDEVTGAFRSVGRGLRPKEIFNHTANTALAQVFCVGGQRVGPGDRVTLVNSPNNQKSEARVGRVYVANYGEVESIVNGTIFTNTFRRGQMSDTWVALDRHLPYAYPPGSEVLKFPSNGVSLVPRLRNALLQRRRQSNVALRPVISSGVPTQLRFGATHRGATIGPGATTSTAGGEIDEMQVHGSTVGAFRLLENLDANSREIIVDEGGTGLPSSGLIKVDNEYIFFRSKAQIQRQIALPTFQEGDPDNDEPPTTTWSYEPTTAWRLSNCSRGILGTRPTEHGARAGIFNMRGFPAFELVSGGEVGSSELTVSADAANIVLNDYGFMRIEGRPNTREDDVELIGYNDLRRMGGNQYLVTTGNWHPQDDAPLFRGVYGTRVRAWDGGNEGAIVTQFNVREPDFFPRWMRGESTRSSLSTEYAYIQGSESFNDASLTSLKWYISDGDNPELRDAIQAKLVLRFDGAPGWDTEPSSQGPIYAYDFEWTSDDIALGAMRVNEMSIPIDNLPESFDRLEWRIYTAFAEDAYERDRWKGTLSVHGVEIELDSGTKILSQGESR